MASYSAPHHTKEDEKRELSKLSDEEKEKILDDMYGRRRNRREQQQGGNNNNNNENDDDDISDELLEEFDDALQQIPVTEMIDYVAACNINPEVVMEESDERRFIRSTDYDAQKAAHRLVEYWKLRVQIFGKVDAFKPMTIQGAMKNDIDVMLFQIPNLFRILPNDKHGRAVVCIDKANVKYSDFKDPMVMPRMFWFVMHKVLQRSSTSPQRNGIVAIVIERTFDFDFIPRKCIQLLSKSETDALPIQMKCIHLCCSSLVLKMSVPVIKHFMSPGVRQRVQLHSSLQNPTTLNELQAYGLQSENLPKSIGGSCDVQQPWIYECQQIYDATNSTKQQQQQRRHRNKRERRFTTTTTNHIIR